MFEVARWWLAGVGALMVIGGVALTLLVNTPLLRPIVDLLERPFWTEPTSTERDYRTFVYGVAGGTMAGWGVAVVLLASQGFPTRQAWVWWALTLGVAVWYALDTGRSIRHRVHLNAALNTLLLVAAAIPLALSFGEFH